MGLIKIVGTGSSPFYALLDLEGRLPFPLKDAKKYKQLTMGTPGLILNRGEDEQYAVEIEYELEPNPTELEVKEVIESQLGKKLEWHMQKLRDEFGAKIQSLDRTKVDKIDVKKVVDEGIQQYFKDWMKEK